MTERNTAFLLIFSLLIRYSKMCSFLRSILTKIKLFHCEICIKILKSVLLSKLQHVFVHSPTIHTAWRCAKFCNSWYAMRWVNGLVESTELLTILLSLLYRRTTLIKCICLSLCVYFNRCHIHLLHQHKFLEWIQTQRRSASNWHPCSVFVEIAHSQTSCHADRTQCKVIVDNKQ